VNILEYRAAQDKVNQSMAAFLLKALRLSGNIVTLGQLEILTRILFPQVSQHRSASANLAKTFYDSMRALEVTDGSVSPPLRIPQYKVDSLLSMLKRVYAPKLKDATAQVDPAMVIGETTKHVEDAARQSTISMIARDPLKVRYQRFDPGIPCAFCALLISRGAVYLTNETAGFRAHAHCRCMPIPVFKGQRNWTGKAEATKYEKLYASATKGSGDSLTAFRRAYADSVAGSK